MISVKDTGLGSYIFSKLPFMAIDIGTSNTRIYTKQHGRKDIVYNEPSKMIQDIRTKEVIAIGHEADLMDGKLNKSYKTIELLEHGTIRNFSIAVAYLQNAFRKSYVDIESFVNGIIFIAVPSNFTSLELRATKGLARYLGFTYVFIESQAKMAAKGANVNIFDQVASMIIDIGAGSTDIALIASNSIIRSSSVHIAGHKVDTEIIKYFKSKLGLLIGKKTVKYLKENYTQIYPSRNQIDKQFVTILGGDASTNLPKKVQVNIEELTKAALPSVRTLAIEIHKLIEDAPPQAIGDIKRQNGFILTGGMARLKGLDRYLAEKFGIQVTVAQDPDLAVIHGLASYEDVIADRLANYEI